MAKKRINKYIGAIALGTVILAVPSCSDTWDDHYGTAPESSTNATQTLWELIEKNPNLSKFAEVAKNAKYYKDEKNASETYSYADMLKSGQICTVWAPENNSMSDAEWNTWLERCKTDGYNVQQQIIGNHIAVWRHVISDAKIDTLKMINGKNLIFNTETNPATLEEQELNITNQAAINGTLHTIKGIAPFHYNFYEYAKYSGTLPEFSKYVWGKDTTYFDKNASIEGVPDKYGKPTYVDRVERTHNRLMDWSYQPSTGGEDWVMQEKGFNARINAEDSMFIMLMPTDKAWKDAIEKLRPYYRYASFYEDRRKNDQSSGTNNFNYGYDPDTLTETAIMMDIIAPLVFNIHKQPKIGDSTTGKPWTLDRFVETKGEEAKYLLNMIGDTLRTTEDWDKTSLFNGKLVKMSNGYAYEIDSWNFPLKYYKPDVEVEIGWGTFYKSGTDETSYYKVGKATTSVPFSNETYRDITEKYGKVSRNNFYYINQPASGNTVVEFKLVGNFNEAYVPNAQVMSGKYDVYAVMVPKWYKDISEAGEIDSMYYDSLQVAAISAKCKNKFRVGIRCSTSDPDGIKDKGTADATPKWAASNLIYDATKVDTMLLIEDFEFVNSYKNLRYSYPTLKLESNPTSTDTNKNGFIKDIYIDRIILRSKEDGSQIEIDQ